MSKVKIFYEKQEYAAELDEISPELLQEHFDLAGPPKYLLDEKKNEIINSKYWEDELKSGSIYRILKRGINLRGRDIDEKKAANKSGINETFRGAVLHSLIASTAVYKMNHEESDEALVKEYLFEQIGDHLFKDIILSKHGENFYLLAREEEANRIYIAFRGRKGLLDRKFNLQVMQFFSLQNNAIQL